MPAAANDAGGGQGRPGGGGSDWQPPQQPL